MDSNDYLEDDSVLLPNTKIELEHCVQDYNTMYQTQYSTNDTKDFYDYYTNVSKRMRKNEIDILLVVSMLSRS